MIAIVECVTCGRPQQFVSEKQMYALGWVIALIAPLPDKCGISWLDEVLARWSCPRCTPPELEKKLVN